MKTTSKVSLVKRVEKSLNKLVGRCTTSKGIVNKLKKQRIKGRCNVCPLHVYLSRSLHLPAKMFEVGGKITIITKGEKFCLDYPDVLGKFIGDIDNGEFPDVQGKWTI